jgi:hypothetical protein
MLLTEPLYAGGLEEAASRRKSMLTNADVYVHAGGWEEAAIRSKKGLPPSSPQGLSQESPIVREGGGGEGERGERDRESDRESIDKTPLGRVAPSQSQSLLLL